MSKKIKINGIEAEKMQRYYATTSTEIVAIYIKISDLMRVFNLLIDDEVCLEYNKITDIWFELMILPIWDELNMLGYDEEKYISENELTKLKKEIKELPAILEEILINFFNKVNAVVEDKEAIDRYRNEILEIVKNIYILVNILNEIFEKIYK